MEEKKYKIYIEVPENYFEIDGNLDWLTGCSTIRKEVYKSIKEAVIEQFIKKIKLPDIEEIPEEEIRLAVKERIVDEIMENNRNDHA